MFCGKKLHRGQYRVRNIRVPYVFLRTFVRVRSMTYRIRHFYTRMHMCTWFHPFPNPQPSHGKWASTPLYAYHIQNVTKTKQRILKLVLKNVQSSCWKLGLCILCRGKKKLCATCFFRNLNQANNYNQGCNIDRGSERGLEILLRMWRSSANSCSEGTFLWTMKAHSDSRNTMMITNEAKCHAHIVKLGPVAPATRNWGRDMVGIIGLKWCTVVLQSPFYFKKRTNKN